MTREHIIAHTGLRGIAAALVALLHMHFEDIIPNQMWEPFISIAVSWYPVDVFFMLSGFILGYSYVSDIRHPRINYRYFIIKRFARVAPLHYLTILIAGIMAIAAGFLGLPNRGYHLDDILPQILMIHAYPFIGKGGWNGPSWSISMEFFAYLFLFPALLVAFSKVKNFKVIVFLMLMLMIAWAISEHSTRGWPAVIRVSCHFSIGYIIYCLSTFKSPLLTFAEKFASLWIILAIAWMFSHEILFAKLGKVGGRMSFQCIFILLILGTARNKDSLTKAILGSGPLVWLGMISYSIYMIHNLIGKVLHVFVDKIKDNILVGFSIVLLAYLILIASSWIIYKYFEVPCRHLIVRLFCKPTNIGQN